MRKTLIIARRELAGYFVSPMAYVIGGLFLLVLGGFKFIPPPGSGGLGEWFILAPGQEATLRPLFVMMAWAMVVAGPLLAMRLLSEEYHVGTIETLMTAPVTDAQVVVGKFLGVMGFYLALLAATVVYLLLMAIFGQPDPGVAAMGYMGMVLLGAAFLAVGMFSSALTHHQLLAMIVGVAILSCFTVAPHFVVAYGGEPWNRLAACLNAMTYFRDFSRGIFDSRGLVFFATAAALFLYLSIKTLESKRWR